MHEVFEPYFYDLRYDIEDYKNGYRLERLEDNVNKRLYELLRLISTYEITDAVEDLILEYIHLTYLLRQTLETRE